jgi:hypothetical protein
VGSWKYYTEQSASRKDAENAKESAKAKEPGSKLRGIERQEPKIEPVLVFMV